MIITTEIECGSCGQINGAGCTESVCSASPQRASQHIRGAGISVGARNDQGAVSLLGEGTVAADITAERFIESAGIDCRCVAACKNDVILNHQVIDEEAECGSALHVYRTAAQCLGIANVQMGAVDICATTISAFSGKNGSALLQDELSGSRNLSGKVVPAFVQGQIACAEHDAAIAGQDGHAGASRNSRRVILTVGGRRNIENTVDTNNAGTSQAGVPIRASVPCWIQVLPEYCAGESVNAELLVYPSIVRSPAPVLTRFPEPIIS